jgi:hypothetical protein
MNVEIGTETPIFLFWEYLFRNFGILSLQCTVLYACAVWGKGGGEGRGERGRGRGRGAQQMIDWLPAAIRHISAESPETKRGREIDRQTDI